MKNKIMKIYVFGNRDFEFDKAAFEVSDKLKLDFPDIEFIEVKPNEDVPFEHEKNVIILDTVEGLKEPKILSEGDLDKFVLNRGTSAHDYDLGFQLKYLKKLGKIGKVIILGIPMNKDSSYSSIHSIFKKLVAQDMQGS